MREKMEELDRTGPDHCLLEVVSKFVIREFSCLIIAPDQVVTRLGLGIEVVHKCPQSTANPVTNNRIADLSTDRVGHLDGGVLCSVDYETYS